MQTPRRSIHTSKVLVPLGKGPLYEKHSFLNHCLTLWLNSLVAAFQHRTRWNRHGFHHATGGRLNTFAADGVYLLEENISLFDSAFFSVTQEEAAAMDPQQRLLLEISYEAIENAGITTEGLSGSKTGCWVGAISSDWLQSVARSPDDASRFLYTSTGPEFLSNRLSWFYNLKGPSMTVFTACSSGLVVLHQACQSLLQGECDTAFAGGVNLIFDPTTSLALSGQDFLAPDGRCKTFDASGDGYARGEGCAVVVLKRVRDALRDNDDIRAVIRGTAVNQDGKTKSMTAPSTEAQASLIRATYRAAGLDLSETSYFETHGTGTPIGDPVEARAVAETLGATRDPQSPLVVGGVKPNIGHTEAVAGLAGLIKGVLMLEKGMIPPNIHLTTPNPSIPFKDFGLRVPTSLETWATGHDIRRLSLNSFGAGGTNAHAIVESFSTFCRQSRTSNGDSVQTPTAPIQERPRVFPIQAHDKNGVQRQFKRLLEHLEAVPSVEGDKGAEDSYLERLSYTLAERRSHLPWAGHVVASSLDGLRAALPDAILAAPVRERGQKPRLGFVFTGQGAQWPRMGVELMGDQAFAASVTAADQFLQTELGCTWSAVEELGREPTSSNMDDPAYAQPLSTILQVALVQMLESWDVTPSSMVGHSSGEVAAAYCAGAISREDAWRVAYTKGVAFSRLARESGRAQGAMLAAGLSAEGVQSYIEAVKPGRVVVACINSPESITLSGDAEAVESLCGMLTRDGIFARLLRVKTAYHSHHVESAKPWFVLPPMRPPPAGVADRRIYSTVSGRLMTQRQMATPRYWWDNLRMPVRFSDAFGEMVAGGVDIVVEIGPHSALQGPIGQIVKQGGGGGGSPVYRPLLSRGRNSWEAALDCAGFLLTQSVPARMGRINGYEGSRCKPLTDLPPYAWSHATSFWAEPRLSYELRNRAQPRRDLIGAPMPRVGADTWVWRGRLRPSEEPWILDHVVGDQVLYPAAGFLCMAIEGAYQLLDSHRPVSGFTIRDFGIQAAAVISPDAELEASLILQPAANSKGTGGWLRFSISTLASGDQGFRQNCEGLIRITYEADPESLSASQAAAHADERRREYLETRETLCTSAQDARAFYGSCHRVNLNHGPAFQVFSDIRRGRRNLSGTITVPATGSTFVPPGGGRPHVLHPVTLDALILATSPAVTQPALRRGLMVPRGLDQLHVRTAIPWKPGAVLRACTTSSRHGLADALADGIAFADDLSQPLLEMHGLRWAPVGDAAVPEQDEAKTRQYCHRLEWLPAVRFLTEDQMQAWIEKLSPKLRVQEIVGSMALENPDLSILDLVTITAKDSATDSATAPIGSLFEHPDCEAAGIVPPPARAYTCAYATAESAEQASAQWSAKVPGAAFIAFDPTQDLPLTAPFDLIICREGEVEVAAASYQKLLTPNGRVLVLTPPLESPDESWGVRCKSFPSATTDEDAAPKLEGPSIAIIERRSNSEFASELARTLEVEARATIQRFRWDEPLPSFADQTTVVCLAELDEPLLERLEEADFAKLKSLLSGAGAVWWLTALGGPAAGLVTGVARVLRSERAGFAFRTVHADPEILGEGERATACRALAAAVRDAADDMEYVLRAGRLHVGRLVEARVWNREINDVAAAAVVPVRPGDSPVPLRLGIKDFGILNGLRFEPDAKPAVPLADDEVEVEIKATGVNFRDVMTALGELPDDVLGRDAAGIVVRAGAAVQGLAPGDRVCFTAPGAHTTRLVVPATACQVVPAPMSFCEGAALPLVATTAYHALAERARLRPGQTVLIHAAAGGVGQCAVQVAQHLGLVVFATVGSAAKRALLRDRYGLADDRIFASRDAGFAAAVRRATAGRGVDCVLNQLAGDLLRESWHCLAPLGTFVELGIKDGLANHGLEMRPFVRGASFVGINLAEMWVSDRPALEAAFAGAFDLVRQGVIKPPPIVTFPFADVTSAFKLLQTGRHLGKVTLSLEDDTPVPVLKTTTSLARLAQDRSYLLVGGLGGLGRSMSHLLVACGARNLCYLSRSGPSSPEAEALVRELKSAGVQVRIAQCDIADETALVAAVQTLKEGMPPIRGVIQNASVLRDSVFANMTFAQWQESLQPKMQGSWNLHQLFQQELDFFIMLSSFAGIFGSPGQANYCAGATYQDALAHHRRASGLKAVSLDLGAVRDVGMLADRLNASYVDGGVAARWQAVAVGESEFHTMMALALRQQMEEDPADADPQIVAGFRADALQWADTFAKDAKFSALRRPASALPAAQAALDSPGQRLASAQTTEDRVRVVCDAIADVLSRSLHIPADEINQDRPLYTYGVDSLVAVEMKNWIAKEFKYETSVLDIIAHVPIVQVARKITEGSRLVVKEVEKTD